MVAASNWNLQAAAANSSGSGREPPSANNFCSSRRESAHSKIRADLRPLLQFFQFISRQLNQRPDGRGIKLKFTARRRKQFRQRSRAAEREGFFVIVQRLHLVRL